MRKTKAVYPISANPPTWGHGDIVYRASQMYDEVYWIIANNPNKQRIFGVEQRLAMMHAYIQYYQVSNVIVDYTPGSVARYAEAQGASVLLRGLRNTTDFHKEFEMSVGNRGINKEVETVCIFSKPHFACISSSLVRELVMINEPVDQYVLPAVARMMDDHFKGDDQAEALPTKVNPAPHEQ